MTTLVERLRGYNPPDRTVDSQRQISVDIHEAADTIEAQAAEIERQNATIDSYINTAAVLAAKVEAQSAEIERLKASFTNELDSLSNRNYQLRMANADQAALLKQCWGYFNEIRMNDDQNRWTCDQAIAAIEQWENGK